ncbi:MAG: hypothetical protein K0M40_17230 [Prolixibacteraceae bacterium]|nr:hypothetical protein [Prolixibacteraceae bacterium]
MKTRKMIGPIFCLLVLTVIIPKRATAQALKENPVLDAKVKKFLSDNSGQWQDMNVPTKDAQLLYDLVIKGKYTSALEIGTSTGLS